MPDKAQRKREKSAQSGGARKRTVIRGTSSRKNNPSPITGARDLEINQNSRRPNSQLSESGSVDSEVGVTGSKPLVSPAKELSKKSRVRTESLRKATIAVVTSALIFGFGIQVGSKTGSSSVDEAISTILDSSAKDIDRDVLERAAIEGALKASGDEWANYFPTSALDVLEEQNSNMFTGIGIWLNRTRGGQIKIASIQEDSPASKSGLSIGDQLLEINGTDVRGASLTSAIALIRGDIGKRIELLVNRDDKMILASLSTEKVALSTVEANQVSSSVALVEIASFSSGTAEEVQDSLEQLNYKSGVILDLRNNPGGLIEEAVKTAQLFIGNGVIVSYQVNGAEKVFKALNPNPISVPVVVLINRNTASSAEIVASAFQDRNRGVVLGERSYGKGSVQEFVTLDDGSKLELTVALYVTPSGRIIDEVGVTPDLEVSSRELNIKALQVLGGLASLNTKKP